MDAQAPDILVVDDDPWIVELVIMAAEERTWSVVSAADRSAALRLVMQERPRLVLLDVRLQHHSGWELLAELEQQYPLHPPVIMMTADYVDDHSAQLRGASAILHKPFSVQAFFDLLGQYLSRSSTTASPAD